jgi:hypothetical protein
MKKILLVIVLLASFLVGCSGSADQPGTETMGDQIPSGSTTAPDVEAAPAPTPTSLQPTLTFDSASYTDDETGFTFEYPVEWEVAAQPEEYARGQIIQFFVGEEPVLTVSKLLWDPRNDLAAYTDYQVTAWLNSEVEILSDENLTLDDGSEARRFIIEGIDGVRSLFMVTELGDRYLVISGTGDLDVLTQVSGSLMLSQIET